MSRNLHNSIGGTGGLELNIIIAQLNVGKCGFKGQGIESGQGDEYYTYGPTIHL